ncbi:MAG: hypothetical protein BMS9Abin12_1024 [Acidimicrobiia bacterium]|nr:MAG: hypothetical protein BMS9Abin12_1024 [Acidimicrobiia bacterium]
MDRKDSKGKRSLFETPPIEIEDSLKDDPLVERHDIYGHEAMYSAGHHERGTGVVDCSSCKVKTRISHVELAVRILALSLWVPGRSYSRHMQCPSCQTRAWCNVKWTG